MNGAGWAADGFVVAGLAGRESRFCRWCDGRGSLLR